MSRVGLVASLTRCRLSFGCAAKYGLAPAPEISAASPIDAAPASPYCSALRTASAPGALPESASTLPVVSENVGRLPENDDPGPVTLPVPSGGTLPAEAGEFTSAMVQSAWMPLPPVPVTATT